MRINQNISALNAYRNMVSTDNRLNKSLERLSSGLRINRAADDAAGLAISEKMRGQIRGLNQAMRNAQDGISLIQTAEGALNETHSILQRMRELSVQAASDTLTSSDRVEIQKEINQLTAEIDRIANTTEFNTKKLLDGTTSALTSTSDLKTKVFMRDGLRVIDQFGQKAVEGGNFRLQIEATPGDGQVQKTDIFMVKHDSGAYDVLRVREGQAETGIDVTTPYEAGQDALAASVQLFGENGVLFEAADAGEAGNDFTVTIVQGEGNDVETAGVIDIDGNLIITLGTESDGSPSTVTADDIAGLTFTGDGAALINATAQGDGTAEASETSETPLTGGADAVPATPQVATLTLDGVTGGSYSLEVGSATGDDAIELDWDATAQQIEDAINAASGETGLGQDVSVAETSPGSQIFTITFHEDDETVAVNLLDDELEGASENAVNEQQRITLSGATGGTFTLTVDGEEVSGIDYNIDAGDLQTLINDVLVAENDSDHTVAVSGSAGNWLIEFYGAAYAGESQAMITMDTGGIEGIEAVGEIAKSNTSIRNIDRFWDASGNFYVDDPQTITLIQGDGSKASFTIFGTDTIAEIEQKLNNAIHGENGLNQGDFLPGTMTGNEYVTYVEKGDEVPDTFFSVAGTFVIQSAVTGKDGEITFVGNENVINALSLTTIQESTETQYDVTVTDAHTGDEVAQERVSGNMLIGAVHQNVDVKFDAMANVRLEENPDGSFNWVQGDPYDTFVHLADNSMVFHIGANPLQDIDAAVGDMRAEALGVDNILVTNREAANRAITQIDGAIERVSSERSKMGALQNRLEHTISNLGVSAENLTAAESRIRDLDFAMEMIEFTRNQIMMQAGTAMLAQANMKPQSVLMLLG